MYEVKGGAHKYALEPEFKIITIFYEKSERRLMIEKYNKIIKDNSVYEDIKVYGINFNNLTITILDMDKIINEF